MEPIGNLQLGKQNLTENFIKTLRNYFKRHKIVKVSVLRSCCRDREELKKISEKILNSLGKNFTARIIGYTIVLKRLRKTKSVK